jgi:hypothetical protein
MRIMFETNHIFFQDCALHVLHWDRRRVCYNTHHEQQKQYMEHTTYMNNHLTYNHDQRGSPKTPETPSMQYVEPHALWYGGRLHILHSAPPMVASNVGPCWAKHPPPWRPPMLIGGLTALSEKLLLPCTKQPDQRLSHIECHPTAKSAARPALLWPFTTLIWSDWPPNDDWDIAYVMDYVEIVLGKEHHLETTITKMCSSNIPHLMPPHTTKEQLESAKDEF